MELQEDRLWLIPNRSVITSVQKWLSCHTQEEIADAVGISQQQTWEILTKIPEKSRREDSGIFVNDFDGNVQKIPSGRFAHFRQFRPRTLHGLELISRLEAEAKERRNAPQRLERDEEGKLKPLPQLIGEEVDDKHVREATHHLARVFSTNRQYVCDAKLLVERALRVKEGLGKPSRRKPWWFPKYQI